ncbi:type VII secretion target, partial [Mycobacterium sp. 050134]|uniref:type VII secretion target n=1 Tax=Mycobacterium sp. 050134 TaxID=3096111 RepID=UPI002EDB72C2
VEPARLKEAAKYLRQAAEQAAQGVKATEEADLRSTLYKTHGPISGLSNEAVADQSNVGEDAGRAIEKTCLALAAALEAAADRYTTTDHTASAALTQPS